MKNVVRCFLPPARPLLYHKLLCHLSCAQGLFEAAPWEITVEEMSLLLIRDLLVSERLHEYGEVDVCKSTVAGFCRQAVPFEGWRGLGHTSPLTVETLPPPFPPPPPVCMLTAPHPSDPFSKPALTHAKP